MTRVRNWVSILALMIPLAMLPTVEIPVADQTTPTPSPEAPRSLFDEDTCAPPCWFGLTPGQSTAEDVTAFLHTYGDWFRGVTTWESSTFDPRTGEMVNGRYSAFWEDFQRDDRSYGGVAIDLKQGIVVSIEVDMNRVVSLGEALARLGTPDYVQLECCGAIGEIYLELIYLALRTDFVLVAPGVCSIANMREDFRVDYFVFSGPGRFAYSAAPVEGRVSPEVWSAWLQGKVDPDLNCIAALSLLPEATEIPFVTPEATVVTDSR